MCNIVFFNRSLVSLFLMIARLNLCGETSCASVWMVSHSWVVIGQPGSVWNHLSYIPTVISSFSGLLFTPWTPWTCTVWEKYVKRSDQKQWILVGERYLPPQGSTSTEVADRICDIGEAEPRGGEMISGQFHDEFSGKIEINPAVPARVAVSDRVLKITTPTVYHVA